MNPALLWVAGAIFTVAVLALAWAYRRLARRAELEAAEEALEREFDHLERR